MKDSKFIDDRLKRGQQAMEKAEKEFSSLTREQLNWTCWTHAKTTCKTFIDLVPNYQDVDLDKCIINSPTITWITYSLRNALEFLFEHEHRHINQAIGVKENERFPNS